MGGTACFTLFFEKLWTKGDSSTEVYRKFNFLGTLHSIGTVISSEADSLQRLIEQLLVFIINEVSTFMYG